MGLGIRFRVAGPADAGVIRTMMAELMPHADTARRYEWLYGANPDGPAVTVLAIDDESGDVAGMTSAFPRRLFVHGRIVLGALGGDGWVRPRYRRRGIASMMHLVSRAAHEARGIVVMFGTPTAANATPLRSSGARDVSILRRWVRPLLARRLGFHPVLRDLVHPWAGFRSRPRLSEASVADADLDVAWAQFRADARICTVRDSRFLGWRFQQASSGAQRLWLVRDAERRVLGSCVVETSGRVARIVDVVTSRDRFAVTLHAIVSALDGVDMIELRLDDATARALHLRRYGFIARESVSLNVMVSSSAAWAGSPFASGNDWFISWADTDTDHTRRVSAVPAIAEHERPLPANFEIDAGLLPIH